MEGNLHVKIDWAGLVLGRKFTVFLCFTPYLRAISKFKSSWGRRGGGDLYLEGRFNGGFFALRFYRACIWRVLYMEGLIFGSLRYL